MRPACGRWLAAAALDTGAGRGTVAQSRAVAPGEAHAGGPSRQASRPSPVADLTG
jgi:hypothetical protein